MHPSRRLLACAAGTAVAVGAVLTGVVASDGSSSPKASRVGYADTAARPATTVTGQVADGTAASRYKWGTPLRVENFSGTAVNKKDWELYEDPGKNKPGGEKTKRRPKQATVKNGVLTITGLANGWSEGMAWHKGIRKYGRWETRVRSTRGCGCYHPVLLLWGESRPAEVDYMEVIKSPKRNNANFFLHYGNDGQLQSNVKVDLTKWHTFAVEVTSTRVNGYLDGKRWFHTTRSAAIPRGTLAPTIQLDWFPGDGAGSGATMQVDWIKMYKA
ncbi:glycoside hydrolase family 16 protein [Actinoallomurus sp. NPDC052308]|uniref:glycoside hydrolase family 16 protein n=1 Tax=Actinoallomurus sp. NPDC052308 TaxID=3155530 RepID=UPI00341F1196